MPRPNLTVCCLTCGTIGKPVAREIPFCSSRCRVVGARRGILLDSDSSRFDAKTVREGDCLIFSGDLNHAGYGTFYVGRYSIRAHVFAWIRKNGPVPDGQEIAHSCHRRACVDDRHLAPSTHLANMQHSARDGRMASGTRNAMHARPSIRARGERTGSAKLTESQVREIRTRYQAGGITKAALAREYGISSETARQIIVRKKWTHVA